VSLQIFDAAGRVTWALDRGEQRPGQHVVPWEGINSRGLPVSAGLYFYRIRWSGQQLRGRFVIE
jgi:hypothetical protein